MTTINILTAPQLAKLDLGVATIAKTAHASQRAEARHMNVPNTLILNAGSIIEMEHTGREIVSIVVRKIDVCGLHNIYVLANRDKGNWALITCYVDVAKTKLMKTA